MKAVRLLLVLGLALVGLAASGAGQPVAMAQSTGYVQIVKFAGVVESCPAEGQLGSWVISGETVEVVESTIFVEVGGTAAPGAQVLVVAGQLENGTLEAIVIRVEPPMTPVQLTVRGMVTNLGDNQMLVNALRIRLTSATRVEGQLGVGAFVRAEVSLMAGGLVANRVTVEPPQEHRRIVEFSGTVESMDGALWVVEGIEVLVTEYTVIDGVVEVGTEVNVRALQAEDGTLLAVEIGVKGDGRSQIDLTHYRGIIEHFPARLLGQWTIGGHTVMVNTATEVLGTPQVGLPAEVEATRYSDGQMVASRITVLAPLTDPVTFSGPIERLPARLLGIWRIAGQAVMVTEKTAISGTPQVGATAEVQALRYADGLLVAGSIAITGSETPATPHPGGTPQPDGTPQPTGTPQRSGTPQPSCTPRPTEHRASTPQAGASLGSKGRR